jgi:hypothetical protein
MRRNVYGAIFSHGPFFELPSLKNIRDKVLEYAVCSPGKLVKELQFHEKIHSLNIDVISRPTEKKIGELSVTC